MSLKEEMLELIECRKIASEILLKEKVFKKNEY